MAVAPSAMNLAAALQAGIDPKRAQAAAANNQYLASVLAEIGKAGPTIRTKGSLLANLLASGIAQHAKTGSDQALAGIQQEIARAKFPNNQAAQLDYLTDPGDVDKARATAYQTADVRQGNTLHNPNGTTGDFTAPLYWHEDGQFGTQGPQGVQTQGQRPMGYGEQTAIAAQGETARHNTAQEVIGNLQAQAAQQQANAAMIQAKSGTLNAQTNQGQLGLGQGTAPSYAPPKGFIIGHPGAH